MKKIIGIFSKLSLSAALLALLVPSQAFAAAVSVTLSSSAGSVQNGSQFQVTVYVNAPGDASGQVSDALVRVTYDSNQLTFIGADYSGTPLTDDFGSAAGGGYYTVDRYKLGAPFPTGTFTAARLTFQAKAGSGTTNIGISSADSSIGDANNGLPHSPLTVQGVSVALTSPQQTPAPGTQTPATSTSAPKSTAAAKPGNNATPTEATTTEQTTAPAVEEPAETGTDVLSQLSDDTPLTSISQTKKLTPMKIALIAGSAAVVLVAGLATLMVVKKRKSTAMGYAGEGQSMISDQQPVVSDNLNPPSTVVHPEEPSQPPVYPDDDGKSPPMVQ